MLCWEHGVSHTDHKMFRARVVCGSPKSFRKLPVERPPGRFDVLCLKGDCVDEQGKMTTKGLFVNGVSRRLQAAWNQEGSVEEKWTLLKTALTDTAQSTLGTQKRRSPDWIAENSSKLLPLYEQRNKFYLRYINTNSEEDRNNFKRARNEARRATRGAKNQWFVMTAKEAKEGRNGGKVVWKCIRDIQRGRKGLVPVNCTRLLDEEGKECKTPRQKQERWRRHFEHILNIYSQFDREEIHRAAETRNGGTSNKSCCCKAKTWKGPR